MYSNHSNSRRWITRWFPDSRSLKVIQCRSYVTLPASPVTMVISIMTEIYAIKEVISMMCVHTNRECHTQVSCQSLKSWDGFTMAIHWN